RHDAPVRVEVEAEAVPRRGSEVGPHEPAVGAAVAVEHTAKYAVAAERCDIAVPAALSVVPGDVDATCVVDADAASAVGCAGAEVGLDPAVAAECRIGRTGRGEHPQSGVRWSRLATGDVADAENVP